MVHTIHINDMNSRGERGMSIVRDLAKLAAEKIIYTLETPREVRKQDRQERKIQREPWTTRYFGMLPMSIRVWRTKKKQHSDKDSL